MKTESQAEIKEREIVMEIAENHPDRFFFACHLPGWLDKHYLAGNISESAYRKICRENAIKMFKLQD